MFQHFLLACSQETEYSEEKRQKKHLPDGLQPPLILAISPLEVNIMRWEVVRREDKFEGSNRPFISISSSHIAFNYKQVVPQYLDH